MPRSSPAVEELGVVAVDDLPAASTPSCSARTVIGVPCSSVPETISTSVAAQPLVAREDVGRQVGAGDVAEVQGAVGVPGRRTEKNRSGSALNDDNDSILSARSPTTG